MTATATLSRPTPTGERELLKRAGNPFRNYFARNPDDDVCGRFHVPELFVAERDLLHAIIDLYRNDPTAHSEVVPILGNKGAGKTHLLHSIKHGAGGAWQLLVTPGTFQKDTDYLEYLLFQIIDTLLGGGKQKGVRPLEQIGEQLVRTILGTAIKQLTSDEKVELFPPPGIGRWARRLGIGHAQAAERAEWLADTLLGKGTTPVRQAISDAGLTPERAFDLIAAHVQKTEPHNATGLMRRNVINGFTKAVLLKDESELANFLTFGFTEIDFQVRPTRQDLVLALFKVMMQLMRELKIPVVVAFDQLEDLLLARRNDDCHRVAEAFFAGIVQIMHQLDGLCFLIFAERGLWNRFVPSLDGYIQDRLNNPVHVPNHGTVKALRLEAPPANLVRRVVEARLRPVLDTMPHADGVSDIYPFLDEQISQVARTEPTLRDMLQQFRHLYDHMVADDHAVTRIEPIDNIVKGGGFDSAVEEEVLPLEPSYPTATPAETAPEETSNRVSALLGHDSPYSVRAAEIITTVPVTQPAEVEAPRSGLSPAALADMWETEYRSARRKLEPDGALTGATRELQSALGTFLTACHEHGVKVGPWRLQHVVPEWSYGDHPTYGIVSLAHWACKDGQPWKVGVGLFLAKGPGKPKDLEIKLGSMTVQPTVVDHLILMRTEDDLSLTGKSKTLWADAEKRGNHARLEAVTLDAFAMVYSFPRWLAAVRESLPEGTPLPNLADVIQEKCERLLEQVCMPVQG
ncbi:hypothetical protein [Limnoglobus roseus]|uniref:ATP-binding protein n=1 Tax=Limnoglobus roseus TaxID=2598579 RepID=A0A5C1AQR1_9BACT|nr:hypothetical protein [Limnoglobus roseus]QEL20955.1 hypothetical protein PX52LOC_08083 [Limnoglobus roseus]